MRAAGYDLKVELVPHDDHDEQLIRLMLATTVEERLESLEEQSDFFAGVSESRVARGDSSNPSRRMSFRPRTARVVSRPPEPRLRFDASACQLPNR